MNTLMNDKLKLSDKHSDSAETILDILGVDADNKFNNGVLLYQTAAIDSISIGGQSNVQPGTTVQVSIRDQGILLMLDRTCICFDLNVNDCITSTDDQNFIDNAVSLFRLMNFQLGNISGGVGNGEYLLQQHLKAQKEKYLKKCRRGLLQRQYGSNIGTGLADLAPATQLLASSKEDLAYMQSIRKVVSAGVVVAGTYTPTVYQCCIPLKLLIPQLSDIPDDILYLGMGQQLVANWTLSPFNSCFTNCVGAALHGTGYNISNAFLVKSYVEVPHEYQQKIHSANISLPVYNIISTPRPANLQQSFTYNVPANQRLRKIVISMHPTTGAPSIVGNGSDTPANIYAPGARFWQPIAYHPQFVVSNIQMSVNGKQQSINSQSLSVLMSTDLFGDVVGNMNCDTFKDFKSYILQIDLTRFGLDVDLFGSGERVNLIQLDIQLSTSLPSLYYGQTITQTLVNNFTFQSFVHTQFQGHLEGGIYKSG